MEKLGKFEEYKKSQNNGINLYYVSHENCNVCKSLLPKIEKVLNNYDGVNSKYVDINKIPRFKGERSVFTVPTIIVDINGKETIRESRYIQVGKFEEKLKRYYDLIE
ncbi:MAG: thioredoxin family protein [Fusobacteriota bacterium]